jgi:hypothetical protein
MTSKKNYNYNDLKFYLFLKKYQVRKGKGYTHKIMSEPYGDFYIPDDKYEQFIKLYTTAIFLGSNIYIEEKHHDCSPILIELCLKQKNANRIYDNNLIINVIKAYNNIIKKYVIVECVDIVAYVLETSKPMMRNKQYYEIICIVYPFIYTNVIQQKVFRKEFIDLAISKKFFKKFLDDNEINDIFDENIIYYRSWPLYGAAKNEYREKHILTHIYYDFNKKIEDTLIPDEINNKIFFIELIKTLCIRKKNIKIARLQPNIDPPDIDFYFDKNNIEPSAHQRENNTEEIQCNAIQKIDGLVFNANNDYYIFGTEKLNYNVNKLIQFVESGKFDEAKIYLKKYFVKVMKPIGVLLWMSAEEELFFYEFHQIKKIIPKIRNNNFDIQLWFLNDYNDFYLQNINVSQGRIYKNNDQLYINLFPGYLHTHTKSYDSFSSDIKGKVELIWNHIKIVWCSDQDDLFDYNKKWISHMVSGRKMTTCLYLKSGQGTGKSVITEFLQHKVLGIKIVYATSNPDCITGFNKQLLGKVLLVLEELPATTKSQWCTISNALKHFITGKTYTNKEKNITDFEIDNNISVIINTNNNAIKIESDDRRFLINDISHEKLGDQKYFTEIHDATYSDNVGEAFYWYCREYSANYKDFKEFPPPLTQTKKDLIIDNLHSLFDFIKDEYIKTNTDIDMLFGEFHDEYAKYLSGKKLDILSKIEVGRLLKANKIPVYTGTNNYKYLKITAEELYKNFDSKKWIHDIDEIHHLYLNK